MIIRPNLPQNGWPLLKELITAWGSYAKAHALIKKHQLWKWTLLPGIVYALLFMISMYFFGKSANAFIDWIWRFTRIDQWIESLESSLIGFVFTVAGLMLWCLLMLFYFSLFKYVWLIVGSPVFAYLSEKTAEIISGKTTPFSWSQLLQDFLRGIRLATRNALWQTVYTLSIILLSFIPIVGWATPVLALFIECYYYGFSMLDYSAERKKLTAPESVYFISNHKGLAIGNGMVFYAMHLLPVIGWILAPTYAVIAATISMEEATKN
jgi:CysZ protein